jgi:hypothetical protein
MPLLDLKTDLKALKYSNDQPGGGWSGLPYIKTNIPPTNLVVGSPDTSQDGFNPIYRPGSTGGLDFPIRGGEVNFSIGTQTFTLSSKLDRTRIQRFFQDKKRGETFLRKQIGLQLTNPKIETGNSFQVAPQSNILPGLLENTRIYNNGANTLLQVGLQGTGTHLPRHGIIPFDYASKYYSDIVGAQNKNPLVESAFKVNRLVILQKLKLAQRPQFENVDINTVNKLGIALNRDTLFRYLGGPGSTYGIGTTLIRRSPDSDTSRASSKFRSGVSMTYDQIMNQKLNDDFDRNTGQRSKRIQSYLTGSKLDTREATYGLVIGKGDSDKMNTLSSFLFNNDADPWGDSPDAQKGTKDIIKFVFEAIENNNPQQSWALFFRAMLSGFSDNHQASISSFKYLGRGEDFYTYQGVSRAISFSFKIAVMSAAEMKPLYTKLNHLISQVYPDYSSKLSIMRAPIVRLTIGDYIYRLAGMLENVSVTIDDNSSWEILSNDNLKQLPHVINVQCNFKPIQDFLPRRENNENTLIPFIGKQSDDDFLRLETPSRTFPVPTTLPPLNRDNLNLNLPTV